jgi:hypothetical protein
VPARGAKAKNRPDTQTFATRLTLVTKMPNLPPARAVAHRRRWPLVAAALAIGSLVTWGAIAASRPDERAAAVAQTSDAPPEPRAAKPSAPTPPADEPSPPAVESREPESPEPPTPPPSATANDTPPSAPTRVALEIEPSDAVVLLDGKKVADPGAFELPAGVPNEGSASIVVRKDGFATRSFVVDATHRLPSRVVLKPLELGFLEVVAPGVAWAAVTVDGKNGGHTPLRKLELLEGKHRVVVKCAAVVCGSERTMLTKTIVVKPGQVTKLQAE